VKVGDSWTDTVTQKFSNQGIQGTSTLVVTSRVLGDTTVAGRGAWRVQRSGMMTTTGSGSQGGQPLVLEGHGQLNGTSYVSPRGVYLGSEEMQTAQLTVQAPAMNMTIPISQRITSHTELLSGGR
jgi:expansin (peptidoglycan-binding protein)